MKVLKAIAIIILMIINITTSEAEQKSGIAAVVNDQVITAIELHNRYNTILALNNISDNVIDQKQMKEQVLYALIDEKIISEEAAKVHISISPNEENQLIKNFATQNNIAGEDLDSMLIAKGITKAELIKILNAQLLWSKLIKQYIEHDNEERISKEEVLEQFEIIKKYQLNNRDFNIKLAELVISKDDDYNSNIKNLLNALNSGASFDQLVRDFSIAPSRDSNGEMGWIQMSQLSQELLEKIKTLQKGQVSKPVVQENSVTIFKILDKKPIITESFGVMPTTEQELKIKELLKMQKTNIKVKAYLYRLKKAAFIEKK